MLCYLIYHEKEALYNQAFIEKLTAAGKGYGLEVRYVSFEAFRKMPLPAVALNRTREKQVSLWYEKQGVTVLHSSFLTELGNDKEKTLAFFKDKLPREVTAQKWAPVSVSLSQEAAATLTERVYARDTAFLLGQYPLFANPKGCVLKSVDGHGGKEVAEVFLPDVKDSAAWETLCCTLERLKGKRLILQEKIESDSQDVRVYLLGNRIYKVMLRTGQQDFRSNFTLGGTAREYTLSARQREYIMKFINCFSGHVSGLAGLDFILDVNGNLIFNELEEMVGCRMLYQNTDCDVALDYIKWLAGQKEVADNRGIG